MCKYLVYRSNKKIKTPYCKLKKCWNPVCNGCESKEYKQYKTLTTKASLKQSDKPMKNRSSKLSKACDISQSVKTKVLKRDNGLCVICGEPGQPNMHYIARSQLGLGIEQNVVCGCLKCHHDYDNGLKRDEYGKKIKKHLKSKYPAWNEEKLVYRKYDETIRRTV